MKICIVGAGIAGLVSAKVLRAFGHHVTVFEKQPDVGGVWSAARRYPELNTQNVRSTYAFSDYPFPADYPEWPSGEQVQRYLAAYVRHFGFEQHLRLATEVLSARRQGGSWVVHLLHANARETVETFDFLLVCNGVFSQPYIPDYPGRDMFEAAGGRLCHSSQFNLAEDARGKHVLVVGYGKSACDVAQAVAAQAASTTVVTRKLLWKVPKYLLALVNYKYLLLTRTGESLFPYRPTTTGAYLLQRASRPLRAALLGLLKRLISWQCRLRKLGLEPQQPFDTIARSTSSLVTDGFFQNVAAQRITVRAAVEITGLSAHAGNSHASLSDGSDVPADLIICGTGWRQMVPFLDAEVTQRISDVQGNFRLYRSLLPVRVQGLAFNGYNSSLFCQLSAEMGALWLAAWLSGTMSLPDAQEQEQRIDTYLSWMAQRTEGQHLKGTTVMPYSIRYLDDLLADMQLPLNRLTRVKQWLRPLAPADFAGATSALLARSQAAAQVAKGLSTNFPSPQ